MTEDGSADRQLVELSRAECLQLLASESIGRVAVSQGRAGPLVVPVNYVLDGEAILFRSGYGAKLRSSLFRVVSFQVDRVDVATRTGWSVLVRGPAEELRRREVTGPLPEPWMPGDKPYVVRIAARAVTGRRIV